MPRPPGGSTMPTAAVAAADAALADYAAEPGRHAWVEVRLGGTPSPAAAPAAGSPPVADPTWAGGVAPDEVVPAASLLKLPLAAAVERALAAGRLPDPDGATVSRLRGPAGTGRSAITDGGPSVLDVLDGCHRLSVRDLLGLMLSASDGPATRWLTDQVGIAAVRAAVAAAGCEHTTVDLAVDHPAGPLVGTTTARDALRLLSAVLDDPACPTSTHALRRSIRNSRIPLGAVDEDIEIAHKTGTLAGLAHDVAELTCDRSSVRVSFLTQHQHDTLVSGYAMGICTRQILQAFGLSVRRTTSAVEGGRS